jgi:hypothetical protein
MKQIQADRELLPEYNYAILCDGNLFPLLKRAVDEMPIPKSERPYVVEISRETLEKNDMKKGDALLIGIPKPESIWSMITR